MTDECPICKVLDARGFDEPKRQMIHALLDLEYQIAMTLDHADQRGIAITEDDMKDLMDEVDAVADRDGATLN